MASLYGNDLFGEPIDESRSGVLNGKFLVAPFSVISSVDGWWRKRKRAWIGVGMAGEVGRSAKSLLRGR